MERPAKTQIARVDTGALLEALGQAQTGRSVMWTGVGHHFAGGLYMSIGVFPTGEALRRVAAEIVGRIPVGPKGFPTGYKGRVVWWGRTAAYFRENVAFYLALESDDAALAPRRCPFRR
jgi:hypothetical protein